MLHTEFRDGNVTAGHEQLRVFKEALSYLPRGIKKVRLRSDTAAYQHERLRYCDEKDKKRFGKIEFTIGCDVIESFREAVMEVPEGEWKPLYREVSGQVVETGKQGAEVCSVPAAIEYGKKGPAYRYVATREELKQPELPHLEKRDEEFLFPVMRMKKRRFLWGRTRQPYSATEEADPWSESHIGACRGMSGCRVSLSCTAQGITGSVHAMDSETLSANLPD